MRGKPSVLALSVALILSACGGEGSDASPKAERLSATALAEKVGCTDYSGGSEEMFVKEGGGCTTTDGESLQVYTFKDNAARDQHLEVGSSFGGTWVIGESWSISADSAAVAEKVASATGGKVKS